MKVPILLIALGLSALVRASTPGQAALEFLEAVRQGKVSLEAGKGTAISPHVRPAKLQEISELLGRMPDDLGTGKLEVGREKIDGDHAGVLIWKRDGFDPSQMQVFAVAMVRRNEQWLAAPMPASFENCAIRYDAPLRKRLADLQSWMLNGRVEDLGKLREEASVHMRRTIEAELPRQTLATLNPREALDRFLQACLKRNRQEMLGLLGGLATQLPENWTARAVSVQNATTGNRIEGAWRMLVSPDVLRVTVAVDEQLEPLLCTIACLDPTIQSTDEKSGAPIMLVHIKVEKTAEGLCQISLPDAFWDSNVMGLDPIDEQLDADLLERFSREVRKANPAEPRTSAAATRTDLIKALQDGNFPALLRLIDIPTDPAKGRQAILRAGAVWASIHAPANERRPASVYRLLDLQMEESADSAAILHYLYSARRPDRFMPEVLMLQRSDSGWLWQPVVDAPLQQKYQAWAAKSGAAWKERWRELMLRNCAGIEKLPAGEPPTEDQARQVVGEWIKAIRAGDIDRALAQCVSLNQADSPQLILRNLSYELIDALRKDQAPAVLHVMQDGIWTGVGMESNNDKSPSFAFYPVIQTPQGPRILVEVDLIASEGRGREFLNRTNLNRLKNIDAPAAGTLEGLLTKHRDACIKPQP
ncbi:MAG TPA: hypothetical protein VFY13_01630 [Luteolibacter sp.]|nr:hypothetical protein [Luteolibacter sp.]